MLTNCLAACTYVSTTVCEIERDNCEIDKTRRTVSAIATRKRTDVASAHNRYSAAVAEAVVC